MAGTLAPVNISEKGIVKNILSLNYTPQTAVKEYLNNVLDKNVDPKYSVNFRIQEVSFYDQTSMFECTEQNAWGFTCLDELRKAFRIADSERTGTNNMGYGIYAPITINKEHQAIALFIQDNENGRFYSAVHFDVAQSSIYTVQGPLEEIEGYDISLLMDGVSNGTKSIWVTYAQAPKWLREEPRQTPSTKDIVGWVKKYYRTNRWQDSLHAEYSDEIMELGKYYHHYLSNGVRITYGGEPMPTISILQGDGPNHQEKTFEISVVPDTKEYRIKDQAGTLRKWNKTNQPFSAELALRTTRGVQSAIVRIVDIDKPLGETSKGTRKIDRKIWVKLNKTYLFCEDFSLRGWPNIRVVIELTNDGENEFDAFISPDANKSNSKINPQIKDRVVYLVKHVIDSEFSENSGGVKISDTLKHDAWEKHIGDTIKGKCMKDCCPNKISVWKYDAVLRPDVDVAGRDVTVDSLMCVCKPCGKQ
jgi:hypothetical protein